MRVAHASPLHLEHPRKVKNFVVFGAQFLHGPVLYAPC
jgi:hypothetical protein